jgi:putative hydrolase of HD superfamily
LSPEAEGGGAASGANTTLLDLALELETLDRVARSGFRLRGVAEAESVAEHSFHVALLVLLLAPRERGIDVARALELALVHDLAEVRIGDLPRTALAYLPGAAKHAAEQRAVADLLGPAPPTLAAAHREYEEAASPEARFVRACDRLQLMLKVACYEAWGHRSLSEFWDRPENFPDQAFASVFGLFEELRRRRGNESRTPG